MGFLRVIIGLLCVMIRCEVKFTVLFRCLQLVKIRTGPSHLYLPYCMFFTMQQFILPIHLPPKPRIFCLLSEVSVLSINCPPGLGSTIRLNLRYWCQAGNSHRLMIVYNSFCLIYFLFLPLYFEVSFKSIH